MRPHATPLDERVWRRADGQLDDAARGNGGFTSSMKNPPLYYLYTTPTYLAASGGDVFTRLGVLRLASLPFLLVTVLFTWLLAGEMLGRRRVLQSVAAGAVALTPQLAFLGGIANPDGLLAAISTAALYLAVVTLRRGPTRGRVLGLLALVVAAALTHGRGVAIAVPVLLTLAIVAWRRWLRPRAHSRAIAVAASAAGTALFFGGLMWYALRGEVSVPRVREFASYVWQFYLPRPDFMEANGGSLYRARRVYVDRLFSELGTFDLVVPLWVTDTITIAALVGLALLVAALVAHRGALRAAAAPAVVLGVAFLALVATLHAAAWRSLLVAPDPILTGRYLAPVIALLGLAVALLVRCLPRVARPAVGTAVLGCGVLMNLSLFAAAVVRFHV
jgi:4-amino-4-deoxy-L-arabinose transferase-like glycosyltransferase